MVGRKSGELDVEGRYEPGGSTEKRSCPLSFVVTTAGPPISVAELMRTSAPARMAPCSSLTVPIKTPVNPCAPTGSGIRSTPAVRQPRNRRRTARATPERDERTSVRRRMACLTISPWGARHDWDFATMHSANRPVNVCATAPAAIARWCVCGGVCDACSRTDRCRRILQNGSSKRSSSGRPKRAQPHHHSPSCSRPGRIPGQYPVEHTCPCFPG